MVREKCSGFFLKMSKIWQMTFNEKAVLESQRSLLGWIIEFKVDARQRTLDEWLPGLERATLVSASGTLKDAVDAFPCAETKRSCEQEKYIDIPQTITCMELIMKHDRYGNVVDWMRGDPKTDSWNGSIDNQEKTLEWHLSKRGWQF